MALWIDETSNKTVQKTMIRITNRDQNGATTFFRNRALLKVLQNHIDNLDTKTVRVLVHACSIGAEPYSLAIHYHAHHQQMAEEDNTQFGNLQQAKYLSIQTTDLNPTFIKLTAGAIFPTSMLINFNETEQAFVDVALDGKTFRINETIRNQVNVISPHSVVDFVPKEPQHITVMNNVLCYLEPEEQRRAIFLAADYTTDYLVTTAFDPDTIACNLKEAGFEPVLDDHEAIHYGWSERMSEKSPAPGTREYFWMLGRYETSFEDFLYRFGTLFRKK